MPTPIGHSLCGMTIYLMLHDGAITKNDFPAILGYIVLANLPDIDFAPILIYGFKAVKMFHQAYTHNLGFCFGSALLIALIVSWRLDRPFLKLFGIFFLLIYSHVILDSMGYDTNPPLGVQLFYPFTSSHFMFPISLFIGAAKSNYKELFSLWNFYGAVLEVVLFLPPLYFLYHSKSIKLGGKIQKT